MSGLNAKAKPFVPGQFGGSNASTPNLSRTNSNSTPTPTQQPQSQQQQPTATASSSHSNSTQPSPSPTNTQDKPRLSFTGNGVINPSNPTHGSAAKSASTDATQHRDVTSSAEKKRLSKNAPAFVPSLNASAPAFNPTDSTSSSPSVSSDDVKTAAPSPSPSPQPPAAAAAKSAPSKPPSIVAERRKNFENSSTDEPTSSKSRTSSVKSPAPVAQQQQQQQQQQPQLQKAESTADEAKSLSPQPTQQPEQKSAPAPAAAAPTPAAAKSPVPTPAAASTEEVKSQPIDDAKVPEPSSAAAASASAQQPAFNGEADARTKRLAALGLGAALPTFNMPRREGKPAEQRQRKLKEEGETTSRQRPAFSAAATTSTDNASGGTAFGDAVDATASANKYDRDFLFAMREHFTDLTAKLSEVIPEGIKVGGAELDVVRRVGTDGWRKAKTQNRDDAAQGGAQSQAGGLRPGGSMTRVGFRPGGSVMPSIGASAGGGSKSIDRSMMGSKKHDPSQTPAKQHGGKGGAGGKGGGGGRHRAGEQPMDIEIKPLESNENAYKIINEIEPDEKLKRSVNAILNKLTPEKFDLLVERVLELNISSAALLRDVVASVFEKAVAEPNFSPTYAQFSVHLSAKIPAFTDEESGEKTTFKRLLLNTAQQEFERQQESDTSEMSDIDRNDVEAKQKRRLLGTIRLIGELYIRKMIPSQIMIYCVALLLGNPQEPNEENVEALCKLITTVGHTIESSSKKEDQEFLNTTFKELKQLTSLPTEKLSSRMRFMVQDIIDLRTRKWVQRTAQKVDAQKTLSEIHKEAGFAPSTSSKSSTSGMQFGSGDVRGLGSRNMLGNGSKLNASSRANLGKFDRYSMAKPKPAAAANSSDDGFTSSGNAGGLGRKTPNRSPKNSSDDKPRLAAGNNAFDMLNDEDDDYDSYYNTNSSKKTADSKSAATTNGSSADADTAAARQQPSTSTDDSADHEEAIEKIKSFSREYFNAQDYKEVIECVHELPKQCPRHHIIYHSLLLSYEERDQQRDLANQLVVKLYHSKELQRTDFTAAFDHLLRNAEDASCDLPRVFEFIGHSIGLAAHEDIIPLSYLNNIDTDSIELFGDSTSKIAIAALQQIKSKHSADAARTAVERGSFKLQPLLDGKDVKQVLKDKKLEELADGLA